ncbi:MAG: hypothetical protein QM722_16470 [Piscinibacter sp.]
MSRPIVPSPLLRRALWADAVASGASALPMIVAPAWLESVTGLSSALLQPVGLALLPYVAYLVWLATRAAVPVAAAWLPIVLNLLWAVDCVLLAALAAPRPSGFGYAFIGLQAAAVLVFAAWQFSGLRTTPGVRPA